MGNMGIDRRIYHTFMVSINMQLEKQKLSSISHVSLNSDQLEQNNNKFLVGEVTEENTMEIIQWIILKNENPQPDEVLTLYINSTGGSLYDAFALIDVMNRSAIPIRTIGIGYLLSAALLIFVSGEKGMRYVGKIGRAHV